MNWRLADGLVRQTYNRLLNLVLPVPLGRVRRVPTSYGRIKVREFGFQNPDTTPLYVDMHGGGFFTMHAKSSGGVNTTLLRKCPAPLRIISIEYPLAPQKKYPAALEASYEVVQYYRRHAAELKIDPARLGTGGLSAGGALATALCMMAKDRGEFRFNVQALQYPLLDLAVDPHTRPYPKGAYMSPRFMKVANECYFGSDPQLAALPYISPVRAELEQLRGLPPAVVILAGRDCLHDEGLRYYEKLKEAGVSALLLDHPNQRHAFTGFPWIAEGRRALGEMAKLIGERI